MPLNTNKMPCRDSVRIHCTCIYPPSQFSRLGIQVSCTFNVDFCLPGFNGFLLVAIHVLDVFHLSVLE